MIIERRDAPALADHVRRFAPRRRGTPLLSACIIIAVVLGVLFRFYHIERKVYWEDETYTSLHVLGLTEADVVARSAQLVDAAALRAVLHPSHPLTTPIGATIHALAVEDPQHPPLYYVAGHVWVQYFGNSVRSIRTLSAVIGVAALPCMYWLCWELFGSILAAWVGVALFAISPIAVLFSQEAREYSLWSLAVSVLGATFLYARRNRSTVAWALYALAVAASLYVFPVSAVVVLGNGIVVAATARRSLRSLRPVVLASIAGCLAFAPWLVVVYGSLHKIDHAMGLTSGYGSTKIDVLKAFVGLITLNFFDFNGAVRQVPLALASMAVLALVIYAFSDLLRSAPRRTSIFVTTLTLVAGAPFLFADMLIAQHFTGNPRYFMPFSIGIDLALVWLFAANLNRATTTRWRRHGFALLFATVIVGRAASCAVSATAETWWNKFGERSIEIARTINAANHPVLLSNEYLERPLSLSNYLDSRVALQLRPQCYLCSGDDRRPFDLGALSRSSSTATVFVLGPSKAVERNVRAAIRLLPRTAYRCIGDQLNDRSSCADGTLQLWPDKRS